MIRSALLSRTTAQVVILVLGMSVLAPAGAAFAFTPSKSQVGGEQTPLHLGSSTTSASSGSGGASLVRTIVGLAIVIAVIWGLTWILRQVKSGRDSRQSGAGLASLATLPLGSGRSLHLVRAGSDHVLIGSAEHGVVPIHRYSEQQAREAGLLNPDGSPAFAPDGTAQRSGALQIPGEETGASLLDRVRDWTVRR